MYFAAQLIVGKSGSGKSSLAKCIARDKLARGFAVGVYDPMRDEWPATFKTHKRLDFLDWMARNYELKKWLCVDESGAGIGKHDWAFDWLCTTGRHLACAHTAFVCHKMEQLSRVLLGQLDIKWIFKQEIQDAKQLADRYGDKELLNTAYMPRFEFYRIDPYAPMRKGRIVLRRGLPFVEFLK